MTYYLSLGSNLGEREQNLRRALQSIGQQVGSITRCSSFYYSEPWGFHSANGFCNLCCAVESDLPPMDVLAATQSIERAMGRTHKTIDRHYTDRLIDIDLIRAIDSNGEEVCLKREEMVNGQIVNILTLPHPLYREREFVTVPLAEITA